MLIHDCLDSANMFASVNVVALGWAQLVMGQVTVYGWADHLGM